MNHLKTDAIRAAASGRWINILGVLAPDLEPAIQKLGRHVPCPVHGGKDGFRLFRDAAQTGGGICASCGPYSDGFALLMWLKGWDFPQCLQAVGTHLGLDAAHRTAGRTSRVSPKSEVAQPVKSQGVRFPTPSTPPRPVARVLANPRSQPV